jgi:hypothetical protein
MLSDASLVSKHLHRYRHPYIRLKPHPIRFILPPTPLFIQITDLTKLVQTPHIQLSGQ